MGAALASVFVPVGAGLIASCAKPYHEETERYVFVATNINLPYRQEAQAGFLDAAKTLGAKGELTGPTTYDPHGEGGMFPRTGEQNPAPISLPPARPPIFPADIDTAIAPAHPTNTPDTTLPTS